MANLFSWLCLIVVALCAFVANAQLQDNIYTIDQRIDPVQQEQLSFEGAEDTENRGDREKRLGIIKKIGIKAGLLDIVFGQINNLIDSKTKWIDELDKQNAYKNHKYFGISYLPPTQSPLNNVRPKTTTPAGPPPLQFQVNQPVSLDIPDRLFANSFSLVTNASRIFGDVIYNTADRAQELVESVNSKLQNKFAFAKKFIKIEGPSTKTRFGTSSGSSSSSSSSGGSSINSGSSSSSSSSSSGSSSFSSSSGGSTSTRFDGDFNPYPISTDFKPPNTDSGSSSFSSSSSSSSSGSASFNLLKKREAVIL